MFRRVTIIPKLPVLILSVFLAGCAGSQPKLEADIVQSLQRMQQRIAQRGDSTHTASYRVRWQVREIEPHSDMILRIDYRAPGDFHVVGKGPMDAPVFTAWVADSQYVLLAHSENEITRGHLRTLNPEDFTIDVRPLGGFLELFAGDNGVRLFSAEDPLSPGVARGNRRDFVWIDDLHRRIELDLDRLRLKGIVWEKRDSDESWELNVRFGRFTRDYPYWELLSAGWENHQGSGKYDWEVLARKYNPDLPEQLFIPPGD